MTVDDPSPSTDSVLGSRNTDPLRTVITEPTVVDLREDGAVFDEVDIAALHAEIDRLNSRIHLLETERGDQRPSGALGGHEPKTHAPGGPVMRRRTRSSNRQTGWQPAKR